MENIDPIWIRIILTAIGLFITIIVVLGGFFGWIYKYLIAKKIAEIEEKVNAQDEKFLNDLKDIVAENYGFKASYLKDLYDLELKLRKDLVTKEEFQSTQNNHRNDIRDIHNKIEGYHR